MVVVFVEMFGLFCDPISHGLRNKKIYKMMVLDLGFYLWTCESGSQIEEPTSPGLTGEVVLEFKGILVRPHIYIYIYT